MVRWALCAVVAAACAASPARPAAPRPTVEDIVQLVQVAEPFVSSPASRSADGRQSLVLLRQPAERGGLEYSLYALDTFRAACREGGEKLHPSSTKGLIARRASTTNRPGISAMRWMPDGSVYYLASEGGGMRLWRGQPGSQPQPVSPEGEDVIAFGIGGGHAFVAVNISPPVKAHRGIFAIDGESAFEAAYPEFDDNDDRFPRVSLKAIELSTRRSVVVHADLGRLARRAVELWPSPDGRHVALIMPVSEVPAPWTAYRHRSGQPAYQLIAGPQPPRTLLAVSRFTVIETSSGAIKPLVDAPAGQRLGHGAHYEALWSPDSRRVVLLNSMLALDGAAGEARESRAKHAYLVEVELATGKATEISPVYLGPRNTRLYMDLRWSSRGELQVTATEDGTRWLEARFARTADGWSAAALADRAPAEAEIVAREGLNAPPELWLQGSGFAACVVSDLNPQLRQMRLHDAESIEWADENGRKWKGGLLLPPDYRKGTRYPLVIQTHGFAPNRFLWDGAHPTAMPGRALAARGFVVLQMADNFERISHPDEAPIHVAGMEAAVRELEGRGLVDPARVGLIGFSATCQYVKVAMAQSKVPFAAGVVADGIDMGYLQYLLSTNIAGGMMQRIFDDSNNGAPFGDGMREWLKRSPGFNTARMRAPLLIQAIGRRDVFFEWEFYSLFRRQGIPAEMLVLRDAVHSLVRPEDRLASLNASLDWMDFWLRGGEDAAPEKKAQYQRWRQLRAEAAAK